MATARPDACFVGIERAWGSMRRLFRRLNAQDLNHVRAIEGDAAFLLQHVFAPQSLSEIWINFSDPWPKERHHNRRLIQDTFVKILAERLKPDGGVTIVTDHADYATWITDIFDATIGPAIHLRNPICSPVTRTHPNQIRTKSNRCGRAHSLFCLASEIGTISRNAHSKGRENAKYRFRRRIPTRRNTDTYRTGHRSSVARNPSEYAGRDQNDRHLLPIARQSRPHLSHGPRRRTRPVLRHIPLISQKQSAIGQTGTNGSAAPHLGRKKSSAKGGRFDFGNTSPFVARIEHSGSVRRMVAQQKHRYLSHGVMV